MSLGVNDKEPCPSRARLITHRAHGSLCLTCEPDAEWLARCPLCRDEVTVVGTTVQPHSTGGHGQRVARFDCPGAGMRVEPPQLVERPIWEPSMRRPEPRWRQNALALVRPPGGVA